MNQPATAVPATLTVPMLRTLGLVAALSGFLVVLAHHLSLPLIEENKRIAIERALFNVIPGAVTRRDFLLTAGGIEPLGEAPAATGVHLYAGYDTNGRLAGVALEAAAQGYQDVIRILYSYDPACECIRGIQVLKMAETPGIGDKIARDPGFLGSKTEPWQIDAISGATISSKAVARMLNDSARQAVPVIMRHLDVLQRPDGDTP
jgi:electron transport complex protein RnfG